VDCNFFTEYFIIEHDNKYPAITKDLVIDLFCDNAKVVLNSTTVYYRRFDSPSDRYYVYAKISNGAIYEKTPLLEATTGYQFKLFYGEKRENNTPILGNKIDEGLIEQKDIDKICEEIE